MQERYYSYNEIALLPRFSQELSRRQIDCSVDFLGKRFKSVAIPANMKCTISYDLATQLSEAGYFYVMHRFDDYGITLEWIKNNQHLKTISISVGVGDVDKKFIEQLISDNLRVDFITVDVAHGHHILVKNMIEFIKGGELRSKNFNPKIIAGNVGTAAAADDLHNWGADAVKVGLSMGKSCTTYNCTGVGTPMFTTVQKIAASGCPYPVIADGQIREVGDVCKALVAGATMVMIGSEFAKCEDSPALVYQYGSIVEKEFYGSASAANKGNTSYIEGQVVRLPIRNETYLEYLNRINEGVQSCLSYEGLHTLKGITNMKYIIISPRN